MNRPTCLWMAALLWAGCVGPTSSGGSTGGPTTAASASSSGTGSPGGSSGTRTSGSTSGGASSGTSGAGGSTTGATGSTGSSSAAASGTSTGGAASSGSSTGGGSSGGTTTNGTTSSGTSGGLYPWTSETVATNTYLGPAAMAVDGSGNLHVVFLSGARAVPNSLIEAYASDGGWGQNVIATNVGTSSQIGLAADATGTLHVAFDGIYYFNANGAWSAGESFGAPGDESDGTAVAVDSAQQVHVAYYANEIGFPVYHGVRGGGGDGGWSVETVAANDGNNSWELSLGILPGDVPAIAYQGQSAIAVAVRDGGGWAAVPVPGSGSSSENVSMNLDATGNVNLDFGGAPQTWAVQDGGGWTETSVPGAGVVVTGNPAAPMIASFDTVQFVTLWTQLPDGSVSSEVVHTYSPPGQSNDYFSVAAAVSSGGPPNGRVWVLMNGPVPSNNWDGANSLVLYQRCVP